MLGSNHFCTRPRVRGWELNTRFEGADSLYLSKTLSGMGGRHTFSVSLRFELTFGLQKIPVPSFLIRLEILYLA